MALLPRRNPASTVNNPLQPPTSLSEHERRASDAHGTTFRNLGSVPSEPASTPADQAVWVWYNTATGKYRIKLGDGSLHTIAPFTEVTGAFALTGDISYTLAASQNDLNPTGLSTASVIRVTSSSGVYIITGLQGGADGRWLTIINVGSNAFSLAHESASSSAANRFYIRGALAVTLLQYETVHLWYDATLSRWVVFSGGQLQRDALWSDLGDMVYGTGSYTGTRVVGNTTTTRKFLRQVGDGGSSAAPAWDTLVAGDLAAVYVPVQYVFLPDAAVGATIVAGDQQGAIHHSGPNAETALRLYIDAETAPGASGLPITIQFGDTDDLDTVASWTTIVTGTLSSQKSDKTDSMSQATIPANRLIRMNIGTIVGTPADATITLRVKRPLSA